MARDQSIIQSLSCYICCLDATVAFERLTNREKLYAHFMARAAWQGSRIIMRQVSPESQSIFDFILETYRACEGNWESLAEQVGTSNEAVEGFLEYASVFLGNIGNYYGRGDQKFVPAISPEELEKISDISKKTKQLYYEFDQIIFLKPPYNLGFPSNVAQSMYYPSEQIIKYPEIDQVSKILADKGIHPENTRLRKQSRDGKTVFEVLQASAEEDQMARSLFSSEDFEVTLQRGDHAVELKKICECLGEAAKYATTSLQEQTISKLIQSLRTGDMDTYRDSQRIWVKDRNPSVETILGFVEPYRDPYGVRAEFEGVVGIVDAEETNVLTKLTQNSTKFIRRLPWAIGFKEDENRGMGPFEKDLFDPPDFTSLRVIAYCSSIIFLGINLPNFNDIRQTDGFKNLMISNRQKQIKSSPETSLVDESELELFESHKLPAWRIQITIHELFGHGTSKLLSEESPGKYNFDVTNRPVSPLTGEPINTWYRPGQTWTGLFGSLATTLDECRAECVGTYLIANKDLLAIFGYTDSSDPTADDLIYNLYLNLGVIGLRSLENYIVEDNKWGQAHDRAHFAMFRTLLSCPSNFMTLTHHPSSNILTVHIDRSKILSHGRAAIGLLLLKLHIYRCTAQVDECKEFYEDLTRVDGVFLEYRDLVVGKKRVLKDVFVQANTVCVNDVEGAGVELREYEPSARGMVKSWVERAV